MNYYGVTRVNREAAGFGQFFERQAIIKLAVDDSKYGFYIKTTLDLSTSECIVYMGYYGMAVEPVTQEQYDTNNAMIGNMIREDMGL